MPKGVTVENKQNNPKELDFVQSKEQAGRQIGGMFAMGRALMGRSELAARANADAEIYLFMRFGIAPILKRIEPHMQDYAKRFPGAPKFEFEDVIPDDEVTQAEIAERDFRMGALTPAERRKEQGRKEIKKPGMDEVWLPMGVAPLSDVMPGEEPKKPASTLPPGLQIPGKPPAPDATQPPKPPVAPEKPEGEPGAVPPGLEQPKSTNGHVDKGRLSRAAQLRYHRDATKIKAREEREFRPRLSRFYSTEAGRFVELVKGVNLAQVKAATNRKADISAQIGEAIRDHEARFIRVVRPIYAEGLVRTFTVTAEYFGWDDPSAFAPGAPAYDADMSRVLDMVPDITSTTRDAVADVIRQGVDMGLSPTEIARGVPDAGYAGIEGTFDGFARSRAQLIARTESSRLHDQASLSAFEDMGVKTMDVVGCEDNVIFEGQTYGCNSTGVPMAETHNVSFHPNHKGTWVPGAVDVSRSMLILTRPPLAVVA